MKFKIGDIVETRRKNSQNAKYLKGNGKNLKVIELSPRDRQDVEIREFRSCHTVWFESRELRLKSKK